jgi:hypothetical protein
VLGAVSQASHGLLHAFQQLLALHQHHAHAGILENVAVVFHRNGRVHGHAHGAELGNAHVGHHPFGPVGADDGDFIGGRHAQGKQPQAGVVAEFLHLRRPQRLPVAVLLLHQAVSLRSGMSQVSQQVEGAGKRHRKSTEKAAETAATRKNSRLPGGNGARP